MINHLSHHRNAASIRAAEKLFYILWVLSDFLAVLLVLQVSSSVSALLGQIGVPLFKDFHFSFEWKRELIQLLGHGAALCPLFHLIILFIYYFTSLLFHISVSAVFVYFGARVTLKALLSFRKEFHWIKLMVREWCCFFLLLGWVFGLHRAKQQPQLMGMGCSQGRDGRV